MIARVAVVLGLAVAVAAADPVASLERAVRDHPDDVDLRLRLAIRLSWKSGRRDEARHQALEVLARAPDYLDAELLLARIDAWEHRWSDARARLERVLAARPDHGAARLLAVDVALWSGDVAAAHRALAALPADVAEVERRYRRAQVAHAEGRYREALSQARRVIALDPDHAGARALREAITLFSVESATDTEVFPATFRDRFAVGETLTATVFPRARWSASAVYEYRRRFATDNHRFALRGDWRPDDRWTLLAFLRAGAVEVIPRVTALVEARWSRGGWVAGGRYTYDRMPWPGDLHRVQLTAGLPLTRALRVEADVGLGTLRGCATSASVWSAGGRVSWTRGRWGLAGAYGYGLEAERAIVGPDPCANPMRLLAYHDVHAGGLDISRTLRRGLALRVAYGLELRASDTRVHLGTLAIRTWF